MVGLVKAADRFDPTKGKSFGKFASAAVYGAIIDDLRSQSIVKRRGIEAMRR
jgi:DNA-directed RNA polymerase specialized sigma subunit